MEARKYVMSILMLALWPALIFAYDNDKIHPLLTGKAIDLFEVSADKTFISAEDRAIILGSIAEDVDPRYLNHFYDPINNVGLNSGQFSSSKQWALGRANTANDFTWDNAIYQYVYGDKANGLATLGHILHLIQDKTVPEHTRDDAHPIVSTYESYTKTQTRVPSTQPIYLNSINEYFDQVAKFTNGNFFSDDTILKYYSEPKIVKKIKEYGDDGKIRNYGYSNMGEKLVIIANNFDSNGKIIENYSIYDKNDNKVMSSYWPTLAPRAVGYSAGVIKLFFDEVKKEQETHALQKARKPWWQKLVEAAKFKINQALAMVSLAKNNPATLPVTKLDPIVVKAPTEVRETMTPEQIRLERLAVLENRLRALRAELEALTSASANQNQVLTVIRSVNSTLASAGLAPIIETAEAETSTTTLDVATTTATTTEEKLPGEPLAIDLSVSTCSFSLTANPCLLKATDTLSLFWSTSQPGDYRYDLIKTSLNDSYEEVETALLTATSATQVSVESKIPAGEYFTTFQWQVIARDASSSAVVATSSKIETNLHVSPLMINEIGWAGTTASDTDEWLELSNGTYYQSLDLNNFYLSFGPNDYKINLSGQLNSRGYYLIERESDEVISNRPANLIDSFGADPGVKSFDVSNLNFKLWQKKAGGDILIEETPVWNKAGNPSSSLERVGFSRAANDLSNWKDRLGCSTACALDRNATTTVGTPGVVNWAAIARQG